MSNKRPAVRHTCKCAPKILAKDFVVFSSQGIVPANSSVSSYGSSCSDRTCFKHVGKWTVQCIYLTSRNLSDQRLETVHCFFFSFSFCSSCSSLSVCLSLSLFLSLSVCCLLYTSDAADEPASVDLGGRRIIKKIF